MSEIFLHCLPRHHWPDLIRDVKEAPLLLLQICSQWRDVALATPRLWSRISLNVHPTKSQSGLILARNWLDRTGVCSLSIHLGPSTRYADHNVIAAVTAYCTRWEEITFDFPISCSEGLGVVKHRLPHLKTLVFNEADPWLQSLDTFEVAPQLRSLELCSGISILTLKLPWFQLTRCDLGSRCLDECFQILKLCPSLIDVVFFKTCGPKLHGSHDILQHPHLQSIHILSPVNLDDFLDRLTLPALIDFTQCEGPSWWQYDRLMPLLKRSDCRLQKLHILTEPVRMITEGDFIDMLEQTPSLAVLNLDGFAPVIRSYTWRRLTHQGSSRCLLPKLQTLRLSHNSDFITHAFVDMIESRWRLPRTRGEADNSQTQVVRLERCFLNILDGVKNVDPAVRTRLRNLRAEGLRIWPVDSEKGF